jgi:hypothetical protein
MKVAGLLLLTACTAEPGVVADDAAVDSGDDVAADGADGDAGRIDDRWHPDALKDGEWIQSSILCCAEGEGANCCP